MTFVFTIYVLCSTTNVISPVLLLMTTVVTKISSIFVCKVLERTWTAFEETVVVEGTEGLLRIFLATTILIMEVHKGPRTGLVLQILEILKVRIEIVIFSYN